MTGKPEPVAETGLSPEREGRFEHLATLGHNWDSYDALPPSAVALVKAREVAVWLAGEPLICPTNDGGVQLAWPAAEERIEIVVAESGAIGIHVDDVEFAPVSEVDLLGARAREVVEAARNWASAVVPSPFCGPLVDAVERYEIALDAADSNRGTS